MIAFVEEIKRNGESVTTQLPLAGDRSRTTRVYEAIRGDILAGRVPPGSRLGFAGLVETYESSIGAIREALNRLLEQGLVTSEPKRGFRVMAISTDDLRDLTTARCEIEVLALRYAVRQGDTQWEANVIAAHHMLERAEQFEPRDPRRFGDAWVAAHTRFHEALLGGCRNTRILSCATTLRDSAELYRMWSAPQHDRSRDIEGEHRDIMAAAVGRDEARAAELLTWHIQRTTDALLVGQQKVSG